jgi:RNA polymerase sigma-70 factor (ECF subfamily)
LPEWNAQLNQSDHELMVAVARGNLASMSEIYQRRHRNLFRFFFRLTGRQAAAEDLVHEVFLRMIRYRHTYQSGDGFEAWMYRIARNAFADQVKKHRLEAQGGDHEFESVESDRPSAFDNVSKQQELALLYRAMRELPEDKRELIVLSRFQGLTYEQIGQIVGCETGTVKVRVFRAMKEVGRIYMDLAKEKAS